MTIEWKEWVDGGWPSEQAEIDAEEAVIDDLVASGRIIYGSHHQSLTDGCPFVDGKPLALSMRSWGRVMAEARNRAENTEKYNYTSFAWYP